jgi:hypothetical protein
VTLRGTIAWYKSGASSVVVSRDGSDGNSSGDSSGRCSDSGESELTVTVVWTSVSGGHSSGDIG